MYEDVRCHIIRNNLRSFSKTGNLVYLGCSRHFLPLTNSLVTEVCVHRVEKTQVTDSEGSRCSLYGDVPVATGRGVDTVVCQPPQLKAEP